MTVCIRRAALALGFALCLEPAIPSAEATVKPDFTPWLRLEGAVSHLKMNSGETYIAFSDDKGQGLRLLELASQKVLRVTDHYVGGAYFWSPDGARLFYREMARAKDGKAVSLVKAYDAVLHKNIMLDEISSVTGFPTLDPRDLRYQIMHGTGITTRQIFFPGERLARWQTAQKTENGKWLATPKGILWLTQAGFTMRRLGDDQSGVESFDISPDGQAMVWATTAGTVWYSREGKTPVKIGDGRDPSWHPRRPLILYAAARKVGQEVIDYDLRVSDVNGSGRYLTKSQISKERWPNWFPDGSAIAYTLEQTTDIYRMEFKP